MTTHQEQYPARCFGVSGQFQTEPSGNMLKTFVYAGESTAVSLKFGLPRIASDPSSLILSGFTVNYILTSGGAGALTSASATLARYTNTNGVLETSTAIALTAPSPIYNLNSGSTINRPYSAVAAPSADSQASTTTVNYLLVVTFVCAVPCTLQLCGADVFYTPAVSSGSSTVGMLEYGNVETAPSILRANGQVVSQATYPALFAKVGITPQFTSTIKTVLPFAIVDIAYGVISSVGTYVAISATQVFVSTDSVQWDVIANADDVFNGLSSIVFFPATSMFVIANNTNNLYYSTDALIWNLTYGPDAIVSLLACSPTVIIAATSSTTNADNAIQYIYRSTDVVTWTKSTVAGSALTFQSVAYAPAFGGGTATFILGTNTGAIQTSPDGTTWTARTSNVASSINAIAHGAVGANGTIVAVGNAGVITVSTDSGATWTAATYQTGATLNGVAYSPTNNNWVACGSSIIMTSTNGTTWNTHMAVMAGKNTIFFGNGLYIACGSNGLLATSTDLITWTARTSGLPTNIVYTAGAYGASTYVIVGAVSTTGRIQSSPDGITWTSRTSNAGANSINHVIFAAGSINLFVAIAGAGVIVTSPDGATWTAQASNLTAVSGIALAFNGTTIVAVANSGKISSSTDGVTWTARTSNTTQSLTGVAWNGTMFCVVGSNSDVVTSPDGTTWTKQFPIFPFSATALTWITSDGTAFYTHDGTNSLLMRSTDAINWTLYPLWGPTLAVNYTNSIFIATTTQGSYTTSTNGITWTQPQSPRGVSSTWQKMYWFSAHSRYLLATSALGGLYSSTDGSVFNGFTVSNPNQGAADLIDIAYSASQNRLIAVGLSGMMLQSTDGGTSFSPVYALSTGISTNHTLLSIAYSPSLDLFVVGTDKGTLFTSTNGTTWTQRTFTSARSDSTSIQFYSIIWVQSKTLFVAVGVCGIATSSDGITWTSRTSNISAVSSINGLRSVAYNSVLDRFVAGGFDCALITSTNGTTWSVVQSPAGGVGRLNCCIVINLEAEGFTTAGTIASNKLYSSDGISWIQISQPLTQAISYTSGNRTKSIYSSVDNCALYPSGNSGFMIKTTGLESIACASININDGYSQRFYCLCYIPSSDTYILGGNQTMIARLTRTYNKATQFALPVLPGFLIHTS